MTTTEQARAAVQLIAGILDTIKEAGPMGAPAGVMYAALMAHGCSLEQFEGLMGRIVSSSGGKIVLRNHCYIYRGVTR